MKTEQDASGECPSITALLLAEHGLADEGEGTGTDHAGHGDDCVTCRGRLSRLNFAMQPAPESKLNEPEADALFAGLVSRIAKDRKAGPKDAGPKDAGAEDQPRHTAPELAGVRLNCTYCKDHLSTLEAAYCASCLAPYHPECFGEHGRCAAPGCSELRVVQSRLPSELIKVAPARPKGRGFLPGLAAVAVGGLIAAAAFAPGGGRSASSPEPVSSATDGAQRFRPAGTGGAAAAEETELVLKVFPVADRLVRESATSPEGLDQVLSLEEALRLAATKDGARSKWVRDCSDKLARRTVTLNFTDTPLREVVGFLADITGLSFALGPGVSAEATVSLRLREVTLSQALRMILDQLAISASLTRGLVLFHKAPAAPPMRSDADLSAVLEREQAQNGLPASAVRQAPAAFLRELKRAVKPVEGESAMFHLDKDRLVVRQPKSVLRAITAELDQRRSSESLAGSVPELQSAWFLPASSPVESPAAARIGKLWRRATHQILSLRLDGTKWDKAVQFLRDMSGQPIEVPKEGVGADVTVSLASGKLRLIDALSLVAAQAGLVVDLNREGFALTRPDQAPLELRLRAAARQALANRELRRRLDGPVSVRMEKRPLGEVLDVLRELGLNILLTREAQATLGADGLDRVTTLVVTERRQRAVLAELLEPHGLTWELRDGVVAVVPAAARAELGGPLSEAEISKVLGSELKLAEPGEGTVVVLDLAGLARRIESSTGVLVVFPEGVGTAEHVLLGARQSLGDALSGLAQQLDLNFALFRDHRGRPGLALQIERRGVVLRALGQLSETEPGEADDARALRGRRAALIAALRAFAKVETASALPAALESVRERSRELSAVRMARRHASSERPWRDEAKAAGVTRKLKTIVQELKESYETRPTDDPAALKFWRLSVARRQSELARYEERRRMLDESVRYMTALIAALAPVNAGQATWDEAFPEGFKAWASAAWSEAREASKAAGEAIRERLPDDRSSEPSKASGR